MTTFSGSKVGRCTQVWLYFSNLDHSHFYEDKMHYFDQFEFELIFLHLYKSWVPYKTMQFTNIILTSFCKNASIVLFVLLENFSIHSILLSTSFYFIHHIHFQRNREMRHLLFFKKYIFYKFSLSGFRPRCWRNKFTPKRLFWITEDKS